jgi:hypothetical protein
MVCTYSRQTNKRAADDDSFTEQSKVNHYRQYAVMMELSILLFSNSKIPLTVYSLILLALT